MTDDPLNDMLREDNNLAIVQAIMIDGYRAALLAQRGEPFYRSMHRALLADNVKRAAELLGFVVSEKVPAGCVAFFPAAPAQLPCDVESNDVA